MNPDLEKVCKNCLLTFYFLSPDLDNTEMSSDCLHDTDVLGGDEDSDWQGEGLDDLGSPNIVKDKEAV